MTSLLACSEPSVHPRNVVLVSLDALSAQHVGTYGYERETTPVLDAIAQQGTVFERAWSQQL